MQPHGMKFTKFRKRASREDAKTRRREERRIPAFINLRVFLRIHGAFRLARPPQRKRRREEDSPSSLLRAFASSREAEFDAIARTTFSGDAMTEAMIKATKLESAPADLAENCFLRKRQSPLRPGHARGFAFSRSIPYPRANVHFSICIPTRRKLCLSQSTVATSLPEQAP